MKGGEMDEEKVAHAVDTVTENMPILCDPSRMTKEEAVAFYRGVASDCNDWAETIQSEINAEKEG
jgi:hypothetical protein